MSATTPALFAAAAGVGFGHAILPDHWVPLAVLGRSRRYRLARVARLSALAAVAHVLLSVVLGGVLIGIGLQFRSAIVGAQDTIIGCLLVATGIGFAALELTGHGHTHAHTHPGDHVHAHVHAAADHVAEHRPDASGQGAEHGHHATGHHRGHRHHTATRDTDRHDAAGHHVQDAHAQPRTLGLAAVMVPFGAAASPDLTILPVFLAATTAGAFTAIGCVVIFAAVTIATIVGLTLGATKGGYQVGGDWLERWGNAVTAVVLVVIGALVLVGAI